MYPACNAHAPYCHLWPVRLYSIFPHYLINGAIFENVLLNIKCVLIFSTTFVWNVSHSKKNWASFDQKSILTFRYSTSYSCPSLIKLESSQQIFEKYSSFKFNENPSSGSQVVPCEQTDVTKLTVAFRNFAKSDQKFSSCFKRIEPRLHYTGQPVSFYNAITSVYC